MILDVAIKNYSFFSSIFCVIFLFISAHDSIRVYDVIPSLLYYCDKPFIVLWEFLERFISFYS